jgi:hypothetical protein
MMQILAEIIPIVHKLLFKRNRRLLLLPLLCIFLVCLTGCNLPQVKAEDRLFLNLALDYLGEYRLPKMQFEGTPVGGLSGIAYDRQRDRFYAISDDRSRLAPARFYTLKLVLGSSQTPEAQESLGIEAVEIEQVTTLLAEDEQPYSLGSVDLEGIAISPQRSLFISSEGNSQQGIAPFIDEFDLETGQWRSRLPIPERYLPGTIDGQPKGIQNNLGFESLTLNADGSTGNPLEPYRIFAATESSLYQDLPAPSNAESSPSPIPIRFLHYLMGDDRPTLLAEHLYLAEPTPPGVQGGLSDLLTLNQGGHFLSLERSFGLTSGLKAEIFQLATGGATDISGIPSLEGNWSDITSIYKRSLLDLSTLDIPLDNLEGMTLGPRLPDGTQSLLLVSDDNFSDLQTTQFLLFRLRE